jgi:hypothetical protein
VISENAPVSPYPGLRSFRRSETHLFFGRDSCVNAMVDRLAATRFLAVLGSSGTGKSSLVKAGLLNALELGLMAQAGSRWLVVDFRPEGVPLRNLSRRLLATEESHGKHSDTDVELLRAFIARGPRSVIEWCRAGHLPPGKNLLLLVDQFEELFRYKDYAGRDEADAFVALLVESAHTEDFPIYVAITMRSEYLGACVLIDGLAEEINAGMYLTPRITREQCREAIVGPARVGNIEIDEPLVNRLLNDLASFAPWENAGAGDQENTPLDRLLRRADQLPLLQYTLTRMWTLARGRFPDGHVKLGLDDYRGLSYALNEHADQIFEQLSKESLPVEEVFRALTSGASPADAIRNPTRFDRLVAICHGDEKGVGRVIEAYRASGCNFLLPEIEQQEVLEPGTMIDISHESLIRQWKRLSQWVAKEAAAAQQWRRLNDSLNLREPLRGRALDNLVTWREETKPNAAWAERYGGDYPSAITFLEKSDRAENNRRRIRRGAVATAFAILLIAAGVAFYQWQSAKTSLASANTSLASVCGDIGFFDQSQNPPVISTRPECASVGVSADERQDAIAAAKAIMASLTEKSYQHLWDEQTSNWFKQRINKDSFLANVTMGRFQVGKVKTSKVIDVTFTTTDPGSGFRGKIYTVNFSNSYETGDFYERIVVIEEGGRFLMSGFNAVPAPSSQMSVK